MRIRVAHRAVVVGLLALLLAGCAADKQGAAKGAIVGAAGGGLLGAAAGGSDGRNMALGAVIGGLIGAITGDMVQQRQAAATPRPPASAPPAPPPPGQWSVVTAPTPPPPVGPPPASPGAPPDPTLGVITNGTQWEIHVFLDLPPGSPSPLVLTPGTQAPVVLDIGQHRVVAQAFVDTQLGRRLVGTFDRTLTVDPRAPGWTIHFFPANF
ncbi:MAG TPA: glycine zipper 2TM domain-containing protein [Methylomirabilota bacterium]|nr:glycine zipper 2TM domain-containing protein [Methylomirabilota bacterium]